MANQENKQGGEHNPIPENPYGWKNLRTQISRDPYFDEVFDPPFQPRRLPSTWSNVMTQINNDPELRFLEKPIQTKLSLIRNRLRRKRVRPQTPPPALYGEPLTFQSRGQTEWSKQIGSNIYIRRINSPEGKFQDGTISHRQIQKDRNAGHNTLEKGTDMAASLTYIKQSHHHLGNRDLFVLTLNLDDEFAIKGVFNGRGKIHHVFLGTGTGIPKGARPINIDAELGTSALDRATEPDRFTPAIYSASFFNKDTFLDHSQKARQLNTDMEINGVNTRFHRTSTTMELIVGSLDKPSFTASLPLQLPYVKDAKAAIQRTEMDEYLPSLARFIDARFTTPFATFTPRHNNQA